MNNEMQKQHNELSKEQKKVKEAKIKRKTDKKNRIKAIKENMLKNLRGINSSNMPLTDIEGSTVVDSSIGEAVTSGMAYEAVANASIAGTSPSLNLAVNAGLATVVGTTAIAVGKKLIENSERFKNSDSSIKKMMIANEYVREDTPVVINTRKNLRRKYHLPMMKEFLPISRDLPNDNVLIDEAEDILRSCRREYNSDDIFIHSATSGIEEIPLRYHFLRDNFYHFTRNIDLALNYAKNVKSIIEGSFIIGPQAISAGGSKLERYLNMALGIKKRDSDILSESVKRLHDNVTRIIKHIENNKERILLATTTNNVENFKKNAPLAWSYLYDINKRMVLLVDVIGFRPETKNIIHAVLHETSHIVSMTSDFIYTTNEDSTVISDPKEMLRLLTDVISGVNNKNFTFDSTYNDYQRNMGDISEDDFIYLMKSDKMLRANVIMDNADFVSQHIININDLNIPNRNRREMDFVDGDKVVITRPFIVNALLIKSILALALRIG